MDEVIVAKGFTIRSQFRGAQANDLTILRKECEAEYDLRMARIAEIMSKVTANEVQKACQDAIHELQNRKDKMVRSFETEKELISTYVEICRTLQVSVTN